MPTHPNIVISEILTSAEASQRVRVANKRGWGNPAENPRKAILIDSELEYIPSPFSLNSESALFILNN